MRRCLLLLLVLCLLSTNALAWGNSKADLYNEACELLSNGSYSEAASKFGELGEYEDATLLKVYSASLNAAVNGQYDLAFAGFSFLGDFRDCPQQILYFAALQQENYQNYEEAGRLLSEMPFYKDSDERVLSYPEKIKEREYNKAVVLISRQEYDRALEILSGLAGYKDADSLVESTKAAKTEAENEKAYQSALALIESQEYDKALEILSGLGGYKDADTLMESTRVAINEKAYQSALALIESQEYDRAIDILSELVGYKDADTLVESTRAAKKEAENEKNYQSVLALIESQEYDKALEILSGLSGYKDSDVLVENTKLAKAAKAEAEHTAMLMAFRTVGSVVSFGAYEQDNSTDNGPEPIKWIVLDVQGNKALLLSKYGLDAKAYNMDRGNVTWENCSLRTWLNTDFLNTAFSDSDQTAILLMNVSNSDSQGNNEWTTSGGNNTQDRIFLLSYSDVKKYLDVQPDKSINLASCITPTSYAQANGAFVSNSYKTSDGEKAGWWWLRSPGYYQYYAACVNSGGSLDSRTVESNLATVRPAMWINLESDIF